jgi:radical SAM superfamily enzyme YgiQ (UPF0313 family)
MRDIILIDPPHYAPIRPSLGLASLYSYLKQNNVDIQIVDVNAELYHEWSGGDYNIHKTDHWNYDCEESAWIKKISKISYDARFIGFSVLYNMQINYVLKSILYIRKNYPDKKIVIGGGALIGSPEDIERFCTVADFVCVGDGEKSLLAVVQAKPPQEIPNLVSLDSIGKVALQQNANCNFDELPTPDYSWANLQCYSRTRKYFSLYYAVTRGCAWGRCTFCCRLSALMFKFRRRKKDTIRDDLVQIKKSNPEIQRVWIVDEFLPTPVLRDVCDVFLETPELQGVEWGSFLRIDPKFTDELVAKLYASGYRWVRFGVESMTQRILDLIDKGTKVEDIWTNVDLFNRHGIKVMALAMYALPQQSTMDVYRDKIEFEKLSKKCSLQISRFQMMKHSIVYNQMEELGIDKVKADRLIAMHPEGRSCLIENGKNPILYTTKNPLYQRSPTWNQIEYEGEEDPT